MYIHLPCRCRKFGNSKRFSAPRLHNFRQPMDCLQKRQENKKPSARDKFSPSRSFVKNKTTRFATTNKNDLGETADDGNTHQILPLPLWNSILKFPYQQQQRLFPTTTTAPQVQKVSFGRCSLLAASVTHRACSSIFLIPTDSGVRAFYTISYDGTLL